MTTLYHTSVRLRTSHKNYIKSPPSPQALHNRNTLEFRETVLNMTVSVWLQHNVMFSIERMSLANVHLHDATFVILVRGEVSDQSTHSLSQEGTISILNQLHGYMGSLAYLGWGVPNMEYPAYKAEV